MSALRPGAAGRGSSLVAVLVVVLFIAVLCAVVLPRYLAPATGISGSVPGAAGTVRTDTAASDAVCRSNVAAARQAVAVYRTTHAGAALPASLSEVELGPAQVRCPVGGEAYTYDSATGTVQCPHAGHEGY